MARGHPIAVRAAVVRTVLSDVVPRSALKTREIGTVDWPWSWRMRCWIIVYQSVYINRVLSGSCHIGCSSHCLCISDDCPNHPGSLGIEAPGILEDEFPLKDCLPGPTKTAWVRGDGNLWWRKSGRDWLIRREGRGGIHWDGSNWWGSQFTAVKGVSSLSEGGGGIGMAGDRAEDHSGGLGMVTLLK